VSQFAQQSVNFWKETHYHHADFPIRFVYGNERDLVGKWPGERPSQDRLEHELALSRMAYIKIYKLKNDDSAPQLSCLTGRIIVRAVIYESDEQLRLRLTNNDSIKYATNRDRAAIVSDGVRITHEGIFFHTWKQFNRYEIDTFWRSGEYISILREFCATSLSDDESLTASDTHHHTTLDVNESRIADTISDYIAAEYELDQQLARETAPFVYYKLEPEARQNVYRQFYRVTLDDDLERMRDIKPSILAFVDQDGDEGERVIAEVVDLTPSKDKPEIIISIERQIHQNQIPKNGELQLEAMPTLQRVRMDVVDELRESRTRNPWLLPVAAEIHEYRKLQAIDVELPPVEYPPTPSQVKAINSGAGTDDYLLVLGPPGTGKTTVISNWIQHFVQQGKRILVTSQNNKAVDNVLERLAKNPGVQCVRLGNETKVSSSINRLLIDNVARDIQSNLVDRLNEASVNVREIVEYIDQIESGLPAFGQRAAKIKSIVKVMANLRAKVEKRLSPKRDKFNKNIAWHQAKDRELHQRLMVNGDKTSYWSRTGMRQLVSWAFLPFYNWQAWRISRAYRANQGVIGKLKVKRDALSEEMRRHEREVEGYYSKIREIESESFKEVYGELMTPNSLIPEWGSVSTPSLLGFRSTKVTEALKEMRTKYQRLGEIMAHWSDIITGERQQSIYHLLLSLVDVVGATCIGINTKKEFRDIPFDVVIVDESGQIQIHNLIVPLSRSPKAILVGDHKQLPPVVHDDIIEELDSRETRTDLFEKSWFEALWDIAPTDRRVMLDTQFRCPAVISDYISIAFYDGEYHAGPGKEKNAPLLDFCNSPIVFIDTSKLSLGRRQEQSRKNGERFEVMGNKLESELVLMTLEKALSEMPELGVQEEIGIIVPYANHVSQIQSILSHAKRKGRLKSLQTSLKELVASVDSYQGQERDLIVMAFTRSNKKGMVGFLSDWRRLNVAMTRAKRQLIMVGDLSTLTHFRGNGNSKMADFKFKSAMNQLKDYVHQRCHYICASQWVNNAKTTRNLPAKRKREHNCG
jgi:DNA polymerase III delta prime subunit